MFVYVECTLVQGPGSGIVSRTQEKVSKVVEAQGHLGVGGPESLFPEGENLPRHRERLSIPPLPVKVPDFLFYGISTHQGLVLCGCQLSREHKAGQDPYQACKDQEGYRSHLKSPVCKLLDHRQFSFEPLTAGPGSGSNHGPR